MGSLVRDAPNSVCVLHMVWEDNTKPGKEPLGCMWKYMYTQILRYLDIHKVTFIHIQNSHSYTYVLTVTLIDTFTDTQLLTISKSTNSYTQMYTDICSNTNTSVLRSAHIDHVCPLAPPILPVSSLPPTPPEGAESGQPAHW